MILISVSTEQYNTVTRYIQSEPGLEQLVQLTQNPETEAAVYVSETIQVMPCWNNQMPHVVFPGNIPFAPETFMGVVFCLLGGMAKAHTLLAAYPELQQMVVFIHHLETGEPVKENEIPGSGYTLLHNKAVALHNNILAAGNEERATDYYIKAIETAPGKVYKAFSALRFADFLTGELLLPEAEQVLNSIDTTLLPHSLIMEIKAAYLPVWQQQLHPPFNNQLLDKIKQQLWECLTYYEQNNRDIDAALLLTEAAHIATICHSFSEAIGYINRALAFFEQEELPELVAMAQMRKANVLQTWAQNDNPQFFRTAMLAYQEALKVYTREDAPSVFADIQHQLGVIYAEIPDEVKKKSVWAAVSVSAFNEALNYFNKVEHPYTFAMICHSFGNAYTKYPAAVHSDNYDKALAWYREALDIRTAQHYPLERTLTLANYLQAAWHVGHDSGFSEPHYHDMREKAEEMLQLATDKQLQEEARLHLEKLSELKRASDLPA